MRILAVGDIVGESGVRKLKEELPRIKREENIDFVIVNGENAGEGMGITQRNFNDLLEEKIDVITMRAALCSDTFSAHATREHNDANILTLGERVVGKGLGIYECNGKKIAVMNFMGRVDINILTENPFIMAKDMVEEIKEQVDIIIIDFHAEATAEKIAMARYLDGKITAIFGTHTHVQTADEQILPNGTGYITDIGMTGPKNSVIGMDAQASIKRFETTLPEKYKLAEGECILNAVIFNIDDTTSKVTDIKRIYIR